MGAPHGTTWVRSPRSGVLVLCALAVCLVGAAPVAAIGVESTGVAGDGGFAAVADSAAYGTSAHAYAPQVALQQAEAFTWEPSDPAAGEEVTFTASETNGDEYRWDFDGNGEIDEATKQSEVTHTYAEAGEFTVVLEVHWDGDPQTYTRDITISPPEPVAKCSVSSTHVEPGEDVTLDASDSENAAWADFDTNGDGAYDDTFHEDLATTTSYESEGEYTPRVRVSDQYERSDEVDCPTITVEANDGPSADFEFTPEQPRVGEGITFDASASSDPDGEVVEYRWDFDDDGEFDETASAPSATYAFDVPGSYRVTLEVTDDRGAVDETHVWVPVSPYARCTISETHVRPGEAVTIDASASDAADLSNFDYDGDGAFDEAWDETMVVTTSYDEVGEYVPRVGVYNQSSERTDEVDCPTITVEANEEPTAEFDFSPGEPRVGEEISFDASASSDPDGEVAEYRWDFDDDGVFDETTDGPTATYAFANPGSYRVTLEVVDGEGATDRTDAWIPVSPYARCSISETHVRPGEEVTIDASASDAANLANFDVDGDGEFDETWVEAMAVTTSYDEPGEYDPRVRVYNQSSERSDEVDCPTITVEANEGPTVDFEFVPTDPVAGEEVTFDAGDSFDPDGEIASYEWDFGDGTTVTTADPTTTHAYDGSGSYTVTLAVTDDEGATSTDEAAVEVRPPDPVARCTIPETVVEPGETVTIDASDSENAGYVAFDVDGDGEYDAGRELDYVVETSYAEAGAYTPRVRASSGDGTDEADCPTITVEANEGPTADFEFSSDDPRVGEGIAFDASASSDPDGAIVEYRWDFDGDGEFEETTDEPTTTHTFEVPGSHQVTLEVADDEGATDRTDAWIPVSPYARCSLTATTVEVGEDVTIDASASEGGDVADFDVDGDGEYDEIWVETLRVTTSYDEPGEYAPHIRIFDQSSERTDEVDCPAITVEANEGPTAEFEFSPADPVAGEEVAFDASDSFDPDGAIVAYRWDFGDGTTVTTADPVIEHAFDAAGTYAIELTVEDGEGATASAEGSVFVQPPEPVARCTISSATVEPGETVTIDASASENVGYVEFDYDGDGEYDAAREVEFVVETSYEDTGTYTPRVRASGGGTDVTECGAVTVESESTEPGEEPSDDEPSGSDDEPGDDGDGNESVGPVDGDGSGPISIADPETAVPIATGVGLAIAGLLWKFGVLSAPGGAGGGGGGDPKPPFKPPKPPSGGDEPAAYETGVVSLEGSGPVTISGLGFEPDVVCFSAPGATGGAAGAELEAGSAESARSAGWTHGLAIRTEEGFEQHAFAAADDAETVGRGAVATTDGDVIDLVRHGDDALGRVRARLTETDDDGFTLDVRSTAGADAAGTRLLYQAFAGGSAIDFAAGRFETPTEPGRQSIALDVDASAVLLATSTAVAPAGDTWETDRSIGLSVGTAVAAGDVEGRPAGIEQAVRSGTVWPGRAIHAAAGCSTEHALSLPYQDADRIAGRTRASVVGLGERLELRYDRTYSGPHKIDPVGGHPVSYLAIDAGELTPTCGVVRLPEPGEQLEIDCGFQPGLLEVSTCRAAALGHERATGAEAVPFGWSHGTAIVRDGTLAQYVVDGTGAPPVEGDATGRGPEPGPTFPVTEDGAPDLEAATAAGIEPVPDGGRETDEDGGFGPSDPLRNVDAATPVSNDVAEAVADVDVPSDLGGAVDAAPDDANADAGAAAGPADAVAGSADADRTDGSDDESRTDGPVTDRATDDDGRIAASLALDASGVIVGRDEVRVRSVTDRGVVLGVDGVRVHDHDRKAEARPYLWYRAWPALDAEGDGE